MTVSQPKNLAASVHQRLLNNARDAGRPFNEVLQYFAMERFLYRLSKSPLSDNFVLKGALLFKVWDTANSRPTMDIDLLGFTDNNPENMADSVIEMCSTEVEPDGLVFDCDSVHADRIKEDADYEGVRVRFAGRLGNARISMQIDVGFGDIVHPRAVSLRFPTILDMPAPELRGYSRESVVAEKLEAMVYLGRLNSRMKDFYDVWLFARQFDFNGGDLAAAIERTFANRGTQLTDISQITVEILENPNLDAQWNGFLKKTGVIAPERFSDILPTINEFLGPPLTSLASKTPFAGQWHASGPWAS